MKTSKSLYIHVPFCRHICGYCDFVKVGYHQELADKVLDRIIEDLSNQKGPFKSIYIGGGTPSALTIEQLLRLKDAIAPFLDSAQEVTMELNPETMDEEKVITLVKMGINRVSVGVQAIQPHLLTTLTRKHSYDDALKVIAWLRKHNINNISVDAMYGIKDQTLEDFKETLDAFIDAEVDHVSLYALTIEENTPFYAQHVQPVDNELEGLFYECAHNTLKKAGYDHYEVSSFTKNNKRSIHNTGYWKYEDFIGVGPGAASKIGCKRTINTKNIHHYLIKQHLLFEEVDLQPLDCLFEHLMMGLRLNEPLDLNDLSQKFDVHVLNLYQEAIQHGIDQQWLTLNGMLLKTTYHGRLFLHDVLMLFMK